MLLDAPNHNLAGWTLGEHDCAFTLINPGILTAQSSCSTVNMARKRPAPSQQSTELTGRASALPAEVQAAYSVIIDQILADSDLNTISAKRIRKGLQEQLDHDISGEKVLIAYRSNCSRPALTNTRSKQ